MMDVWLQSKFWRLLQRRQNRKQSVLDSFHMIFRAVTDPLIYFTPWEDFLHTKWSESIEHEAGGSTFIDVVVRSYSKGLIYFGVYSLFVSVISRFQKLSSQHAFKSMQKIKSVILTKLKNTFCSTTLTTPVNISAMNAVVLHNPNAESPLEICRLSPDGSGYSNPV